MAMKYFQYATFSKNTESAASLKIADMLYNGASGHQDLERAYALYKLVDEITQDNEIKSLANFKLGMMN